jgi:hypothetical protein
MGVIVFDHYITEQKSIIGLEIANLSASEQMESSTTLGPMRFKLDENNDKDSNCDDDELYRLNETFQDQNDCDIDFNVDAKFVEPLKVDLAKILKQFRPYWS